MAASSSASWGDFLALPENRSALRAARYLARSLVAERRPAVVPLVLHGSPGTGKTHLTNALLRATADGPAVVTAQSVSVGDLARGGAGDDRSHGFSDRDFQTCDLLILEDIQHLPEKATDPVCALLDKRAARRRPVVVTANAGPSGLPLPHRLTSRLSAGLVVQLEPLSVASRRNVLASAATVRKLKLTGDALDWLAGRGGVRALLGLLQNLAQVARQYPGPLDLSAVQEIVAGTGQPTSAPGDLPAIVGRVASAFGVSEKELLGTSRLRRVLVPRQVAMYLAREAGRLSFPRIAAYFGRDHTTVLHSCQKTETDMASDATFEGRVRQLLREVA